MLFSIICVKEQLNAPLFESYITKGNIEVVVNANYFFY